MMKKNHGCRWIKGCQVKREKTELMKIINRFAVIFMRDMSISRFASSCLIWSHTVCVCRDVNTSKRRCVCVYVTVGPTA